MVWKTTPTTSWEQLTAVLEMVRTIASFCWKDPTAELSSSSGWRLAFEVQRTPDGYLILVVWPEPDDQR